MMRTIKRFLRLYQPLLVSGGLVLVSVLVCIFGLIPGVRTVTEMFSSMRSLSSLVSVLREKDRILTSLDADAIETYAKAAVSAVPTEKSLSTIFSTIDNLTSREGVVVTSISLGNTGSIATNSAKKQSLEEAKIGVNIVPFSVVIEGPIEQVRNVVDRAVQIRRFLRVKSFDLVFDDKTNISRSTLQMEAYYVPMPKMLTKLADPITPLTSEEINILDTVIAIPLLTTDLVASGSAQIPSTPGTSDPFAP